MLNYMTNGSLFEEEYIDDIIIINYKVQFQSRTALWNKVYFAPNGQSDQK